MFQKVLLRFLSPCSRKRWEEYCAIWKRWPLLICLLAVIPLSFGTVGGMLGNYFPGLGGSPEYITSKGSFTILHYSPGIVNNVALQFAILGLGFYLLFLLLYSIASGFITLKYLLTKSIIKKGQTDAIIYYLHCSLEDFNRMPGKRMKCLGKILLIIAAVLLIAGFLDEKSIIDLPGMKSTVIFIVMFSFGCIGILLWARASLAPDRDVAAKGLQENFLHGIDILENMGDSGYLALKIFLNDVKDKNIDDFNTIKHVTPCLFEQENLSSDEA